jgi:PhzF family phenazine biosynthesis protein
VTRTRSFAQVDVFSAEPYYGNPVAVVLDGDGLTPEEMQRFAAWTNLSETTFLVPPTSPEADYGLRIFTPGGELPFAGHPTLGSAHAWLEAGGAPRSPGRLVQECGVGLVELHRGADAPGALSFRAPELLHAGPVDDARLDRAARGLRIERDRIVASAVVDNGPGWFAVELASAEEVLALEPDAQALADLMLGVVGRYPPGSPAAFEVRGFAGPVGVPEDPVTGSLNAGLGQWLIGSGRAPERYVAAQGTRLGRRGRVSVERRDGAVHVGGASVTCIRGTVTL